MGDMRLNTLKEKDSATDYRFPNVEIKFSEPVVSEGQIPARVQLIKTGTYYDARYGDFSITKEILLSMKKNFDAKVMKIDPAIDYKHDSDDVAAGWITALSVEQGEKGFELWADVKWTPNGSRVLSDREFRYLSADFTNDYVDNETAKHYGPTLKGAGLTNRPVIKGMAPAVQLTEGKDEMAKLEELEEQIKLLADKNKKLEEEMADLKKGDADDADDEDENDDQGDDSEDSVDSLKKKLAESQKVCADMQKKLDEYAEKDKAAQKDKAMAERKSAFDKMLSEGKAVEAQREPFMKSDMIKFAELSSKVNFGGKGHGNDPQTLSDDPDTEIMKLAEKKVTDKQATTIGEAISQVLTENKELAERRKQKYAA